MPAVTPLPLPRHASSFDAVIAALDAAGDPNGRVEADEGKLIAADLARATAKSANNGWSWEQARADHAQRRDGR